MILLPSAATVTVVNMARLPDRMLYASFHPLTIVPTDVQATNTSG